MDTNSEVEPKMNVHPSLQLKFVSGEGLYMLHGEQWELVRVKACFPWSEPDQYLSLLDREGLQIGFVEKINDLPEGTVQALRQGLEESNFCFVIQRIVDVDVNLDLRLWKVDTESGPRTFHTKVSHWPTVLDDGQVFIKDMHGDNYRIIDPEQLDEKSQSTLSALADI